MDLFLVYMLLASLVLLTLLSLELLYRGSVGGALPPGNTGWPVIGESHEFLSTWWKGELETLFFNRMARYSRSCFTTSLFGEHVAVVCGPKANKFLFSNEGKLVESWWPRSVEKIFSMLKLTSAKEEARKMRTMLPLFLKTEALCRFIGIMDNIARRHLDEFWTNRSQILGHPLSTKFTFTLACKLFLSLEDSTHIARFWEPFECLLSGIFTVPIHLPGTPFNRAIKASKIIRKQLIEVIKQRKIDLEENKAFPTQGILSHMLTTPFEGEPGDPPFYITEDNIGQHIMGLLISIHESINSAITFVLKYLAELPLVYDQVYKVLVHKNSVFNALIKNSSSSTLPSIS